MNNEVKWLPELIDDMAAVEKSKKEIVRYLIIDDGNFDICCPGQYRFLNGKLYVDFVMEQFKKGNKVYLRPDDKPVNVLLKEEYWGKILK